MKKIICALICVLLVGLIAAPSFAAEQTVKPLSKVTVLDDDITIIEELVVFHTRSTGITGYKTATVTRSGATIAVIKIQATYSYDGSSVSVVSKSVTQKTTYDGWSYSQQSFTSSGGTVTLNAKLTKLLVLTQPVTVKLTCDKNGNIT